MECPQCRAEMRWWTGCMRIIVSCPHCKAVYDLDKVHDRLTEEDEERLASRRVDRL